MTKKGDTLIEVTLAVGIFSMVAIAVVAVMSNGTSNTQTALETTLARAEIDAQAEALRFIQASAAAESSNDAKFSTLWQTITNSGLVHVVSNSDGSYQFAPQTCTELYEDGKIKDQKAFFINIDGLNSYLESSTANPAPTPIVTADGSFSTTETYPRVNDGKAEGIYIVARRDDTKIITTNGAYYPYDFYIHACWNSSNSDHASTISTVIRLLGKAL